MSAAGAMLGRRDGGRREDAAGGAKGASRQVVTASLAVPR
jgi:hypothetical protein